MFIEIVAYDKWINQRDHGEIMAASTWENLKDLIIKLDGLTRTLVAFGLNPEEDETHMAIGGGNNGFYQVYISFNNEAYYNLINKENSEKDFIELQTGGQWAELPANMCVGLEKVLLAAKMFFEVGKMHPELDWELDN